MYVWKKIISKFRWHCISVWSLVGLIIGNIPGARERNNPDINWVPVLAVQTRAQAEREGVTSKLKTPSIIDRTITPAQVSNAQKDDVSLMTTRSRCEANETIVKATFFKKNDLLYRKFSSPNVELGRIFEQLIITEQYRELVMQLAHESILTGHLSVTSSVHKVLSEYYWPGIYKDVKRFVPLCEVCKGTLHEGKMDRSLSSTRVVNIGTSSKRRYRYFAPKAHPETLEIVPKDRNV